MESKFTTLQLENIIADLQGTTDTLDGVVRVLTDDKLNEDDLNEHDLDYIFSEIFLCEQCGWWCEIGEMSSCEDEDQCEDCYDEDEWE